MGGSAICATAHGPGCRTALPAARIDKDQERRLSARVGKEARLIVQAASMTETTRVLPRAAIASCIWPSLVR